MPSEITEAAVAKVQAALQLDPLRQLHRALLGQASHIALNLDPETHDPVRREQFLGRNVAAAADVRAKIAGILGALPGDRVGLEATPALDENADAIAAPGDENLSGDARLEYRRLAERDQRLWETTDALVARVHELAEAFADALV
jgi:hypothetical protein